MPATVQADDFTVTTLDDDGTGSLREAIEDANVNLGADRVLFSASLSGTIGLSSGSLEINGPVKVLGPGARRLAVSAGGDSRVFDISTAVGVPVTISGLTVTGGSLAGTDAGAGISSTSASLTVSDATIRGNEAGRGGGIFSFGDLTLENSTISGNTATGAGGGVYAFAYDLRAGNSTLSGNTAAGSGGAIYAVDVSEVELLSSTVAGNSAAGAGGGVDSDGTTDVIALDGTIVADNTPEDLHDGGAAGWSGAFNLVEDPGNSLLPAVGNTFGADPMLGSLADNGGPTPTRELKQGSPAKDAGPTSGAPATDQRGAPRKGRADIGAYELVKCGGTVVDVVGTSGKDRLSGDGGKNGILGLGGNDRLLGLRGRDALCGKGGKDKLSGGNSKDKLLGGGGKDILRGGKAADKLNGGPGNDKCVGGSGPGFDKLKSC